MIPADLIVAAVRSEFQRYGYVRWSDVADALQCSRQHVHNVINQQVSAGDVRTDEYETWAKSYMNTSTRKVKFTPDNWEWLETVAESRGRRRDDILNELLNRERQRILTDLDDILKGLLNPEELLSSTPSPSHDNNTNEEQSNS